MRVYLQICIGCLLLLLVACGGKKPAEVPNAPEIVAVTPGSDHLIVAWRHSDAKATDFIIYRKPVTGSADPVEIGRVPAHKNAHHTYTFLDTAAKDKAQYRYSVVAVGPGGTSAATEQVETVTGNWSLTGSASCGGAPTSTDSDGDGVSNATEKAGWTVTVGINTASASGVNDILSQNTSARAVTSNPDNADTDSDGVCDHDELANITDPSNPDSDDDGLNDLAELDTWASSATNVDSDNDAFNLDASGNLTLTSGNSALFDGSEVTNHGTSPTLADSDGDIYTDYTEIIERGPPFNPLIANLPQVELSLVGTADLVVNIGYTDSSQQAQSKSSSLSQGSATSNTDTSSQTVKTWAETDATVSASAKVSFPEGASVSTSVSVTAKQGVSDENTTSWSQTSSQSSQQTYDDAVQTSRQQGRTISGGSIGIGVQISNPGEVSYKLTDLAVTALQRDPADPSNFKAIASLDLSSSLSSGVTLAPGGQTGVLRTSEDLSAGNVILELMANPQSLFFEVGSFSLSNEEGISYGFLEETTNAQTGFIVIDYGNGDVVKERVATNVQRQNGDIVGVTLPKALEILGITYQTQTNGAGTGILTSVTDKQTGEAVSVDSANNKFWAVVSTETLPANTDFNDITLQAGQAVYLLYVTDQDNDSLYARDEYLYGTSDTNKDSDADGLGDFAEAKTGWTIESQVAPYPSKTYSDPAVADEDGDGLNDSQEQALTTDPNSPDTDGDLLCDGPGNSANQSGPCTSGAEQDPQPLVPRFIVTELSPQANAVNAAVNSTIEINFSVPVINASIPLLSVRSLSRGPIEVQAENVKFSNGGRTLTFTPPEPFMAGDVIEVQLRDVKSTVGSRTLASYIYRFGVATQSGTSGTFTSGFTYTFSGSNGLFSVIASDFNSDNHLDLATTSADISSSTFVSSVNVQFNDPSSLGTFLSNQVYNSGGYPSGLTAGDLDDNGRLDLAVANSIGIDQNGTEGPPTVSVLLQSSTVGTFENQDQYDVNQGRGITNGDFDGNGLLDLVTAGSLLLNLSSQPGTFSTATDVPVGDYPFSVTSGDFNSDGWLDVAVANSRGASVSVLLADPTSPGTFEPKNDYAVDDGPQAVAAGDVNGDGLLDLFTANDGATNTGTVSVLINDGEGIFQNVLSYTTGSLGLDITAGDFNGDGLLDLAAADASGNISVLLNLATRPGTFEQVSPSPYAVGRGVAVSVTTGDFNEDGRLDLATLNVGTTTGVGPNSLVIFLGQP